MNLFPDWVLQFMSEYRNLTPYVRWAYAPFWQIALIMFSVCFVYRFAERWLHRMQYIGLSREQRRVFHEEYVKQYNVEPPYDQVCVLDSPPRPIQTKRRLYRFAYGCVVVGFKLLVIVELFMVAWFGLIDYLIESRTSAMMSAAEYYFFSRENLYGILWFGSSGTIGYWAARYLLYHFFTDYFARQNEAVNAEIAASRKQSSQRTGSHTDVRTLKFGEVKAFEPLSMMQTAKERDAVFLGADENMHGVFVPREQWKETNIQILGKPGSGKTVMATNALVQCAANFGDAVVYFDPKNDDWAPHVFNAHVPDFVLLDLRQGKPAQINPFFGLDQYALNDLLVSGFNLAESGGESDFYRIEEQKAVKAIARNCRGTATAKSLLEAAHHLPDELRKAAKGLISKLEDLADLSVLNTDKGIDITEIINRGGCLYIIGSMMDESVIRLQKMLFARCVQVVTARDPLKTYPHASLMIDELKYLLSRYVLNALGTVRSKNCNILLAHQSLGDFGQCGQGLDPHFVRSAVLDNTGIRWFYQATNAETAEWGSKETGEILVDVERRNVSSDSGNIELVDHHVTLVKERRNLFDANMLLMMPKGYAIVTGLGVAKQAFTFPIRVERHEIPLSVAPALKTNGKDVASDSFEELY